uniref:Eukaryotic translation initiation factor 4E binding protein 1 n=1 Tax=Gadus morhua TaxID=8049 RepID=A0A8C4ZS67_GADMO
SQHSPVRQLTSARRTPTRRVTVHDAAHMPQDYSSTPGGTLFSTTPGGTRIIYDRKFLLQCRTSPLARTPPSLPDIPGVTSPLKAADVINTSNCSTHVHHREGSAGDDSQFEMDI